jgi:1-acyl-sn-glycerol-3-phosphate acyltransferase
LKVRGHRFHRGEGGLIVAANHGSWLDAWLVQWAVFPHQLTFLMTEDFFDLPVAGLYFRAVGARPIREDGRPSVAGIKAAYSALEDGKMICLFPEGGIPRDGKMQRGKRGVAHIARKAGVPILPVGIRGADKIYSRMQPKLRWRGRVELHVGEPIRYEGGRTREDDQAFTDRLMDAIRDLAGEQPQERDA